MINYIIGGITAPKGFKANGMHCGIRKNKSKLDIGLLVSDVIANVGSVHTQNKVIGAPNIVTKSNLIDGLARAIICNSGNANTCNADGVEKAEQMCELVSLSTGIKACDVIVASTGVIGQILPIEPIATIMPELVSGLNVCGSNDMAHAIMTTDTIKKEYAVEFDIDGVTCKIGAIAKGSGMIHPNMATMLSFITTDVAISSDLLQEMLKNVVDSTVNMVSVDGDTSTNDMMVIMANGLAGNVLIDSRDDSYNTFYTALTDILTNISKDLASDGEGATKLLECNVRGGEDLVTCRVIAKSVITSNLLKAAMFASDANWGRILCAIGYADAEFDICRVEVVLRSEFGSLKVCENGAGIEFDEDYAYKVLNSKIVNIDVKIGDSAINATAWGCDLTYDYVKINADYRT